MSVQFLLHSLKQEEFDPEFIQSWTKKAAIRIADQESSFDGTDPILGSEKNTPFLKQMFDEDDSFIDTFAIFQMNIIINIRGQFLSHPNHMHHVFIDYGLNNIQIFLGEFNCGHNEQHSWIKEKVWNLSEASDMFPPAPGSIMTFKISVYPVEQGPDSQIINEFAVFK